MLRWVLFMVLQDFKAGFSAAGASLLSLMEVIWLSEISPEIRADPGLSYIAHLSLSSILPPVILAPVEWGMTPDPRLMHPQALPERNHYEAMFSNTSECKILTLLIERSHALFLSCQLDDLPIYRGLNFFFALSVM